MPLTHEEHKRNQTVSQWTKDYLGIHNPSLLWDIERNCASSPYWLRFN